MSGGAYGCGFRRTTSGLASSELPRPAADPSVRRFEQAAEWIRAWDPSAEDLDGYLVSSVATHDAPLKPRQLARRQDGLFICGRPDDWRAAVRREMLATGVEGCNARTSARAAW